MSADAIRLIEILEDIKRGTLSCEEAQLQLASNPLEKFPESEVILCMLEHYWADEEIRQRDEDYRTMQDGELGKLIHRLRQSDFAGAAAVSFIHIA